MSRRYVCICRVSRYYFFVHHCVVRNIWTIIIPAWGPPAAYLPLSSHQHEQVWYEYDTNPCFHVFALNATSSHSTSVIRRKTPHSPIIQTIHPQCASQLRRLSLLCVRNLCAASEWVEILRSWGRALSGQIGLAMSDLISRADYFEGLGWIGMRERGRVDWERRWAYGLTTRLWWVA